MMPRGADVRRALERYPDVTCAEREALWSWYEQARAADLMAALNDPSLEPSLARLQRDHPVAARMAMTVPLIIIAALLATLLVALS